MNPDFLRDRRLPLLLAAAVAVALGLLGFRALGSGAPPAAGGPSTNQVSAVTASSIEGARVTIPEPGVPTAVYFFSASCGSCVDGGRALAQARRSVQGKMALVFVDIDPYDRLQDVQAFLVAVGAPEATAVRDTGGQVSRAFKVTTLSTAVGLDRAGRPVYHGVEPTRDQAAAGLAKATTG